MQAKKIAPSASETHAPSVDVFNIKGEKVDSLALDSEIFAVDVSEKLLAQAVRVHLARERSGTRNTKTRAQVTGSTRKIFRQKGTGNARHGSRKAPIFVGGGVAHGPKPQNFSLDMPKTMRRKALFGALTHRRKTGGLLIVRGLESITPKTKEMATIMTALFAGDERHSVRRPATLLVVGTDGEMILRAGRNLSFLTISQARMLNAYDVMRYSKLIMSESAVPILSQVFLAKKEDEGAPKPAAKKEPAVIAAPKKAATEKKPLAAKPKKTVKK